MTWTTDPFDAGLPELARQLRRGTLTIRSLTEHCLNRIERLDSQLQAFEYIDADGAREQAETLDAMLAAGHDLGPLMGMPVGIKDIYSVTGMPVTNGSRHPASHLNGPEGRLVATLRRAGCVFLGKTRTVEYALGATGLNSAKGTPWNPWDLQEHRMPGGSSSGSAVAVASSMCAFALGSDTGGSIRIPACFNGITGYKPTAGLWPTDGVFPLSASLDSTGPLCRSVADAAWITQVVHPDTTPVQQTTLQGLRFGIPRTLFLDDLDPCVEKAFKVACDKLAQAGAKLSEFELPEARERETLFPKIVAPELLSSLGETHLEMAGKDMDEVTYDRAAAGLQVSAISYLKAQRRRAALMALADELFDQYDAWLTPTCPFTAYSLTALKQPENHRRALLASRNTQPANLFGQCGVSLPVAPAGGTLPVGLQIIGRANGDRALLGIAIAVENLLGKPPLPSL